MGLFRNGFVSLLGLACVMGATPAEARVGRPMITFGSGVETTTEQVNVLLQLNFDNLTLEHPGSSTIYVLARLRANVAINPSSDGPTVPYSDIEFIPVVARTGVGVGGRGLRILPTRININPDLTVRVDVAGLETAYLGHTGFSERAMIYAKVAADALGVKMANFAYDAVHFRGVNIAALNAEAGLIFAASGGVKVRVAFNVSADVSVGNNEGGYGWSIRSDMIAYNEISVDLTRFFRLFVRNGVNVGLNSGFDPVADYQFMGGGTFIF